MVKMMEMTQELIQEVMKSEKTEVPIQGNAEKYRSYREAWARVKQAQQHGFYIEAVTIEESIISDRLTSYLVDAGLVPRQRRLKDYPTFGNLIITWRRWANTQLAPKLDRDRRDKLALLIDSVDLWRQKRNQIIHAIEADIRVAKQQVQPPKSPVIRQRFVARVDDRAVELHPLVNVVHDVIRALADLKRDRLLRFHFIERKQRRIRLSHTPRSSENLPRRQKRKQRPNDGRVKLHLAPHQIVFVAAKRRPRVVIDVVLHKRHLVARAHFLDRLLHEQIAREVVSNNIFQRAALGRSVFEMPHVEIQPAAI